MICPHCASELPAVAKYCVRCGVRIEAPGQSWAGPSSTGLPLRAVPEVGVLDHRRAVFPDSEPGPRHAYADGRSFVVPRDAVLPSRCVKCGNPPADPWLRKTFSWHHPALYVLLISPILYVIAALIVRKTIRVSVPLCRAHRTIRRKRLWIGAILLLTCIPLPWALAAYIGNDAGVEVAGFAGVAMFIIGLVFVAIASPLRPVRIETYRAVFKGACDEFLASLPAN